MMRSAAMSKKTFDRMCGRAPASISSGPALRLGHRVAREDAVCEPRRSAGAYDHRAPRIVVNVGPYQGARRSGTEFDGARAAAPEISMSTNVTPPLEAKTPRSERRRGVADDAEPRDGRVHDVPRHDRGVEL